MVGPEQKRGTLTFQLIGITVKINSAPLGQIWGRFLGQPLHRSQNGRRISLPANRLVRGCYINYQQARIHGPGRSSLSVVRLKIRQNSELSAEPVNLMDEL
jgi:hypothetical protein